MNEKEVEKMKYVDGFVIVLPKKKLGIYKKMAAEGKKAWMKHGALDYQECVGDDMNPDMGGDMGGVKLLTFPRLAKTKRGEVIVFSYILFKSKAHRDKVNAKVMKEFMADPKNKDKPMPFDMNRMAYGGFKVIVGA